MEKFLIINPFGIGDVLFTTPVIRALKERYPDIDNNLTKEYGYFRKTKTIAEMMMVEGRIAGFYWNEFKKIIPDKYNFETKDHVDLCDSKVRGIFRQIYRSLTPADAHAPCRQ